MKKTLIFILFATFTSFVALAQRVQNLPPIDSSLVHGCQKSVAKMRDRDGAWPVFVCPDGEVFFCKYVATRREWVAYILNPAVVAATN